MVAHELLYSWDASVIIGILFLFLLLSCETGFRFGRRRANKNQPIPKSQTLGIEAAMLTLLGLLIAFTFSMSANRYDMRKAVVLEEANAIGTAFLRGGILPSTERQEFRRLLRDYLGTRLEFYRAGSDYAIQKGIDEKTDKLQRTFWELSVAEGQRNPTPTNALLLGSLNAVIDAREKQSMAYENHVPEIILTVLFLLSVLVLGVVGYLHGLDKDREYVLTILFSAMIAITLYLVLDLDRPRQGLIWVSHESLLRLEKSIGETPGT